MSRKEKKDQESLVRLVKSVWLVGEKERRCTFIEAGLIETMKMLGVSVRGLVNSSLERGVKYISL